MIVIRLLLFSFFSQFFFLFESLSTFLFLKMFDWIVRRSRRHIDVIQPRPKNMKNDTRATSIDSRVTLTLPLPFLGDPTYTFDFDAPIDFIFLSWTPFFFYPILFHRFYVQMLMLVISNATSALVISYIQCYVVSVCARVGNHLSPFRFFLYPFSPPTVFISLTKCCCCFISYKFRLHPIWW
jgi:hypothetical protein